MRSFQPAGDEAFYCWVAAIAEHRLLDLLKGLRRARRSPGTGARLLAPRDGTESVAGLLADLAEDTATPSRFAAREEAIAAVRVGLAGLAEDYREVLRVRYVERLPVEEIAARMQRTVSAVHNLCHRGLAQLRAALGRSSCYLTRK